MLEILNWSLEHPWATLLWCFIVLDILQIVMVCKTILTLARKPEEYPDKETVLKEWLDIRHNFLEGFEL